MKACIANGSRAGSRMAGLTLIELMIALTISLIITAAVGYVYVASSATYRTQDTLSRMQEGARYAFEFMGNDLRMTGATGCSFTTSVNALNTSTDWYKDLFRRPLRGTNDVAPVDACTGTGTACYLRGDAVTTLHADISEEHIVTAPLETAGTPQITLNNANGISAGNLLVATDCTHASVFQATAVAGAVVTHAASGTPGNASATLGCGSPNCDDFPRIVYGYTAGSRVYRLEAATYYIGTNPGGEPALYRLALGSNGAPTAEELVEGVENMQVSYGVDTTATADAAADFIDPDGDGDPYLTATQVESGSVPGTTNDEKWRRVVSVKISLLMRTTEDGITPSAQTYTFNGTATVAGDRRLRRVFTHVIKVRNR